MATDLQQLIELDWQGRHDGGLVPESLMQVGSRGPSKGNSMKFEGLICACFDLSKTEM